MELIQILKCIDEESELPGEPSDEMKTTLHKALIDHNVDFLVDCLKIVVRLTKKSISDRIISNFDDDTNKKNIH